MMAALSPPRPQVRVGCADDAGPSKSARAFAGRGGEAGVVRQHRRSWSRRRATPVSRFMTASPLRESRFPVEFICEQHCGLASECARYG